MMTNGYRDYDPVSGRYMETDPLGLEGGMNVYGYVGASPLMGVDPEGLKFVSDTPEHMALITEAMRYLSQSARAAEIMKRLDESPTTITIKITDNFYDYSDKNNNGYRIYWNPNSGSLQNNGDKDSPAIGLAHEFGHVDIGVFREKYYSNNEVLNYDNHKPSHDDWDYMEEHRNASETEHVIVRQLNIKGFNEGISPNHHGSPYKTCSPTATNECE